MPSSDDKRKLQKIRQFESADVAFDVEQSLAKGDSRFLGLYGMGAIVPGVDHPFKLDEIRFIVDTSDEGNEVHFRFQDAAYKYAQQYNRELARQLKLRTQPRRPERLSDSLSWIVFVSVILTFLTSLFIHRRMKIRWWSKNAKHGR